MNNRGRERVQTEITGTGKLMKTGVEFSFVGLDFTVEGMQLQMEGISPAVGLKVLLEFDAGERGANGEEGKTLSIAGEVMRIVEQDGETVCGLRWLGGGDTKNIEGLEAYYTELFFNMIE